MGILVSLFFGFIPMFLYAMFVYWLDRYEKEPKLLIGGAFLWGVVIAAGGAYVINTILGIGIYSLTGSVEMAEFGGVSIVAPIVEEILKGMAVAIVFFLFHREFDSVLDGIIYGGIVGLGFAATENTLYIYRYGFLEDGWAGVVALVIIRVVLVGWMHAFFTAFTGIGFALARVNNRLPVRLAAPLLGLGVAMLAHAFHNTFGWIVGGFGGFALGLFADWLGYAFMFGIIIWMIIQERNILKRQLQAEVNVGLISENQYRSALLPFTTMVAIFSGGNTARFYEILAELAHKKEQMEKHGNEDGNAAIIQKLRSEAALLAPRAK